jgi:hypothetical protein
MQATRTPLARKSSNFSTKPGRWRSEQAARAEQGVGVGLLDALVGDVLDHDLGEAVAGLDHIGAPV